MPPIHFDLNPTAFDRDEPSPVAMWVSTALVYGDLKVNADEPDSFDLVASESPFRFEIIPT